MSFPVSRELFPGLDELSVGLAVCLVFHVRGETVQLLFHLGDAVEVVARGDVEVVERRLERLYLVRRPAVGGRRGVGQELPGAFEGVRHSPDQASRGQECLAGAGRRVRAAVACRRLKTPTARRGDMADEPADESDDVPTDVAMHFYRGELHRVTTWRGRLDRTTNWVVVVLAAILTWSFSSRTNPHYVLLLGMVVATVFLVVEAQRYQKYDAWRERVRLVEANYLPAEFGDGRPLESDWDGDLEADLREPTFALSFLEAAAQRLRNVYMPLLTLLVVAWGTRITLFAGGTPWPRAASVGDLPGTVVVGAVGVGYAVALGLTVLGERVTRREFAD